MNYYVLDNSVAMRWFLASEKKADQIYAEKVLQSMTQAAAIVPHLWHLEATNVLVAAEKRHKLEPGEVDQFIAQLKILPIRVDPLTAQQAFTRTLSLSRAYNLSSYDAAYLELAIREGLALATLDNNLKKAAKRTNTPLYFH